jgi:hypothetical protein
MSIELPNEVYAIMFIIIYEVDDNFCKISSISMYTNALYIWNRILGVFAFYPGFKDKVVYLIIPRPMQQMTRRRRLRIIMVKW